MSEEDKSWLDKIVYIARYSDMRDGVRGGTVVRFKGGKGAISNRYGKAKLGGFPSLRTPEKEG